MAWSYIGKSTEVVAASGNITLNDVGSEGDLLVACISFRDTAAFTLPTGWTLVETQQLSGNVSTTPGARISSGLMAWIVRGSSAPDLTFTRTGGDVAEGIVVAFNHGTRVAYDVGVANTESGFTSTPGAPSITTTTTDVLLVMLSATPGAGSVINQGAATDPTSGSWTQRHVNDTAVGADATLSVASATKATAGATGAFSWGSNRVEKHVTIVGAFKGAPITTPVSVAGETTPTGRAAKNMAQTVRSEATPTGAVRRAVARFFLAIPGAVAALARQTAKTLRANVEVSMFPSDLDMVYSRAFLATATAAASASRAMSKPVRSNATPTAQIRRDTARSFPAVATPTGSVRKTLGRSLAAVSAVVALLTRSPLKPVVANAGVTTALRRDIAKRLVAYALGDEIFANPTDFTQASWRKNRASITPNATTDKDGNPTASKLVEDASVTNTHRMFESRPGPGGRQVFETELKAAERSWAYHRQDVPAGNVTAFFDLTNGVVGNVTAGMRASMFPLADGWWLCRSEIDATFVGAANQLLGIATANGSITYTGDGVSGIYIARASLKRGLAAFILKSLARTLAAITTPTGRVTKATSKPQAAVSAAVAVLARSGVKPVRGTSTAVATLRRDMAKRVLANQAPAALLVRLTARAIRADVAATARLIASTGKPVRATVAIVAALIRSTSKPLRSIAGLANLIPNSTMVGAAPGVLPTGWGITTAPGLTPTVVGQGVESGKTYLEIQYAGTPSASESRVFPAGTSPAIAAAVGDELTFASSFKVTGSAITYVQVRIEERNAGGTFLSQGEGSQVSPTGAIQPTAVRRTLQSATTARVTPSIAIVTPVGSPISFTLRIYEPMVNRGLVESAFQATAGIAPSLIAWVVRQGVKTLRADTVPTASIRRQTAKGLAALASGVSTIVRSLARSIPAQTVPAGLLARHKAMRLAAVAECAATLIRATSKPLGATTAPTAALARATAKTLFVETTPAPIFSRVVATLPPSGRTVSATGRVPRVAVAPPRDRTVVADEG